MSKVYNIDKKQEYLDQYKTSGMTKTEFARENNIPEATFRNWIKEEKYSMFGEINFNEDEQGTVKILSKPIIFCDDKIRIELREGFNKEFLKKIIEVLIYDK